MIATLDTPLFDLPGAELLSVRAKNICRASGIETLRDLLDCTEESLSNLKNCGRKSVMELLDLKSDYDRSLFSDGSGFNRPIIAAHSDRESFVGRLVEACEALLRRLTLPSGELPAEIALAVGLTGGDLPRFFGALADNTRLCLASVCGGEVENRSRDRSAVAALLGGMADSESLTPAHQVLLAESVRVLGEMAEETAVEDRYFALDPSARKLLQREYESLFVRMLSVRARNVFRSMTGFRDLLPYLLGRQDVESVNFKGGGRKSVMEFKALIAAASELLERFLSSGETCKSPDQLRRSYIRSEYSDNFPFLEPGEIDSLVELTAGGGGELPPFYLLGRYISRQPGRSFSIWRKFYGFGAEEGANTPEMTALAEEIGVSRERIRQILSGGLRFPPALAPVGARLTEIFSDDCIPSYSPLLAEDDDRMGLTVRQKMAVVCAVNPEYAIESVADGGNLYLVRRELLTHLSVMTLFTTLRRRVMLRRAVAETLDVIDWIRSMTGGIELHSRVASVAPLFVDELAKLPNVEAAGPTSLRLLPSRVDYRIEVADELRREGKPLSFETLYERVRSRFPDAKFPSPLSFRLYIYQSPEVTPLGKSGNYALKEWDLFAGTMVDFVYKLISEAGEPLSVDYLTEMTRENFRSTTPSSIHTLIWLDEQRRFVAFADGYYGLAGVDYPGWEERLKRSQMRRPFDERFGQLKEFVRQHGRMPFTSDDEYECSLTRWRTNLQRGLLAASPDELDRLERFVSENSLIPQNGFEYRFLENCRSYRRVVEETGRHPLRADYANLYAWFKKTMQGREDLDGNRRLYFDRLAGFLADRNLLNKSDRRKK
ncbi:MAG: hypothetical protein NC336_09315 [Clostridium sp.]|nr:hypothetical protein [Clostridium sp.]